MADSILRAHVGTFTMIASSVLNSVASGGTALSDEFDNSLTANLWPQAIFELVIDYDTTAPTVGLTWVGYIIPALDGTNYPDTNTINVQSAPGFEFVVQDRLTAQRLVSVAVPIPPCKFKVLLVNDTNQPSSGSGTAKTLGILPFTSKIVTS